MNKISIFSGALLASISSVCASSQQKPNIIFILCDDMGYGDLGCYVHIPADTRSAFPVISVQSPVSIQCCWQS